jgi:hypothetical protein
MNAKSNPDWWKSDPWRVGMRARVTSPDVLKEWRDRDGTVSGILENEVRLELDGDGRPLVWFLKSQVRVSTSAKTMDCSALNDAEDAACILDDGHAGQHMDGRQRRWGPPT